MLNLEETLSVSKTYNKQRDSLLRVLLYSIGAIIIIDLLRIQAAEVKVVQLVPGYYLLLIFVYLFLLTTSSTIFSYFSTTAIDSRKEFGTKEGTKIDIIIFIRYSLSFLLIILFIFLHTVIPLSLDSFNGYGEETLENGWSFDEVSSLQETLVFILTILSQLPVITIRSLTKESDVVELPEFWKLFSFSAFVIAGIVTPTVDSYTQSTFAFAAIFLYTLVIIILEKRLTVKFINGTSLS